MTEKIDAIIVGGGIGGCVIGALLAHNGFNVQLFDKNRTIGGRCTSYNYKGFTIDLGVHVFGSGQNGPLNEVCRMIGMSDTIKWVPSEIPKPIIQDQIPSDVDTQELSEFWNNFMDKDGNENKESKVMMKEINSDDVDTQELYKFWQYCVSIPETDYKKVYYRSLSSFVRKFSKNPVVFTSASALCAIFHCINPLEASAGEFIRCVQEVARTNSSAYPIGGCIAIPQAYTDAMEKFGSTVVLEAPIKKIFIENNKAKGVELKDGTQYFSDIIISNADIQNTVLNLVGEDYFPEDYVKRVKKLTYSMHCITIKVALDEPVTNDKFIIYYPTTFEEMMKDPVKYIGGRNKPPEKMPGMITSPTNFDPNLAPEGNQLLFFGTAVVPGLPDYKPWGKACFESLCECIPEIENHLMWYRTDSPTTVEEYAGEGGNIIGVAQNVYQVHERRPSQVTPIKGLFIVGAEAGGHGIGTELAANSAMELLDLLRKNLKTIHSYRKK